MKAKTQASAPPTDNENKALCQQLTEKLAASGAQSLAQGKLALARCIARREQHSHVGKRDEQHKPDHGHENAQRIAVLLVIARENSWLR